MSTRRAARLAPPQMSIKAGSSKRLRWAAIVAATAAGLLVPAVTAGGAGRYPGNDPVEQYANNPCTGPDRHELLCPNLRISKPRDLYISFSAGGRHLLHAESSINSVGFGRMEIRGIRSGGSRTMRVNQRIHKRGGGKLSIRTRGRLAFYPVP